MENVISFQSLELNQEYKVLGYYVDDNLDNGLIFLIIKWNEGASYPDKNFLYELLSTSFLSSYVFNRSINGDTDTYTFNFIVRVNANGRLYPEFLDMKRKYILYNDEDEDDAVDKEALDDLNSVKKTNYKLSGIADGVAAALLAHNSKSNAGAGIKIPAKKT